MKKVLILYSGGADSALMFQFAKRMKADITLLTIKYGQKHEKELQYARDQTLNCRILEVDLTPSFVYTSSNLLTAKRPLKDYPGVHEAHVPARNGIFLFTALSIAETRGMDEVWIGCDYSDRINLFPDCYQEWILRMDELAQISGSRPIRIKAPLLGLSKEDVKALLTGEGVDLTKIFSGYDEPNGCVVPPGPTVGASNTCT